MMGNGFDSDTLYAELRMREIRAAAEEARLARQVRTPRRLRRRVGGLLITAGERLSR